MGKKGVAYFESTRGAHDTFCGHRKERESFEEKQKTTTAQLTSERETAHRASTTSFGLWMNPGLGRCGKGAVQSLPLSNLHANYLLQQVTSNGALHFIPTC